MNSVRSVDGVDIRTKLQALWIFATLNYLYADVVSLFDKSIVTNLDQNALLGASVLVETAIIMVLLSRILNPRLNRIANLISGAINTIAVLASLLVGTLTAHYAFFAVIEIVTTVSIICYAATWTMSGTKSMTKGA